MSSIKNRNRSGMRVGIVGLSVNLILTLAKIIAGILSQSQSLIADGINSLSDSLSSIITVFGFYIAGKPADKDHPYGHERSEYIAGFTIAIITAYLGLDIAISSAKSLLSNNRPNIGFFPIMVMIFSMILKFFLVIYYQRQSKALNSSMLDASAQDSRNDIFMTGGILIALFIGNYVKISVDAILGLCVSIYIMYTAFQMVIGFMDNLLGNRPDEKTLKQIKKLLDNDKSIFGYHDLLVHQYGIQTAYGSVHVELDQSMSLIKAHDIIDRLENEIYDLTSIRITAHADPLDIDNIEMHTIFQLIKSYLRNHYPQASFHDLRLSQGILYFDVVLNGLTCEGDITLELGELLIRNNIKYPIKIDFDIQQLI